MSTNEWIQRYDESVAKVLPRATDIVASSGEGSWLVDVDGNRYLDFGSGIAVNNTGHCHPKVIRAIQEQAATLIHTSVTARHQPYILLAEKLGTLCPFFENPSVFLTNSGTEAVDGAMKLARKVTGKPGIIAFNGGFHGRTVMATSLTTTKMKYREGYHHLPFVYHAPYGNDLEAVERIIKEAKNYSIGAILTEYVLGEGGYEIPPVEWLRGLRNICTDNEILLIADEVQTGIGRTGHWFAAETFGVTPDILLAAKALGSGLPIGAIVAERSVMSKWSEGTHGSTFGGNPISCASALETIDILEPVLPRVRDKGAEILSRLQLRWSPSLDVRGIGYMLAIELSNGVTAKRVQQRCIERGLLILLCGPEDKVIRLIPNLLTTDEEWEIALEILDKSLVDGILMYSS